MENASKALIIAGAILLAILIIGLGMLIFNQARDTVTQANLDQETVAAFNSKFDSYIGDKVKGTQARTLCDLVRNNNLTADNNSTFPITISILGDAVNKEDEDNATPINTYKNNLKNGQMYKISVTYDKTRGGLIDTITIDNPD